MRILICLLLLSSAPSLARSETLSTAVRQQHWPVQGLNAPADIIVDQWGVAHIFAASTNDAFFLQGYNAARDRLWQIDLWRKRGLGRLSKSLGPAYVAQDRAARLFLYRGDMRAEWAAYAPESQSWVQSFTQGINAYVVQVRAGQKPLPVEFKLTDSEPETWQAEDVLRIRSHALVANVTSEVARARIVCVGGVKADALHRVIEPAGHGLKVPNGLDPCDIPAEVLKDYLLATKPVDFTPHPAGEKHTAIAPQDLLRSAINQQAVEGSNNWVVSPSRTATGRALLANDPHRQLGVPSLRYVVALNAPGLNLIGAGEPALPGVSFGHNDDIAFGLTIFPIDQEDLYVYELKAGSPLSYRYKAGWETMRVVHETIEVKGEPDRQVELHFTRHGPVLDEDTAKHRAFALRTVWNEAGLAGYFGSSRLLLAKNWSDFKAASNAWGAPPLNLVYADIQGNIGWAAAGRTPVRRNWDGLMPVPGDGRYEWQGFQGNDVLPSVYNPAAGFFGTANEMNLPPGYPNERLRISFEWNDRSRIDRITERLRANDKVSLADSMSMQTDSVSVQSRRAVALLGSLPIDDSEASKAIKLLQSWDHDETISSAPAAIYEVWATKYLGVDTVAKVAPLAARKLLDQGHLEAVIDCLEQADACLGGSAQAVREAILLDSLNAALAELRTRLGADWSAWSWGRLHHATFEPAVAGLADPQLRAQLSLGPLQTPGSSSTPRAQAYRGSDFAVVAGASVRMVLDVGAWDNSVFINTPGQSADPSSAHYRDLFPLWAQGDYAPLRFSRTAVEHDAETIIHVVPAQ